jgi:hypothetical protein
MVVAREAIVINVGASPPEYDQVQVTHSRTGERVLINKDEPRVPEELGVPYAFKAFQRVSSSHPAVLANPGAFMPVEEVEDLELVNG